MRFWKLVIEFSRSQGAISFTPGYYSRRVCRLLPWNVAIGASSKFKNRSPRFVSLTAPHSECQNAPYSTRSLRPEGAVQCTGPTIHLLRGDSLHFFFSGSARYRRTAPWHNDPRSQNLTGI